MPRTFYDVLDVEASASQDEIRRAYLDKARRLHPDAGAADPRAMQEVNEAWRVLRDPRRRADYDRELTPPQPFSSEKGTAYVPFPDENEWTPWEAAPPGRSSFTVLLPAAVFAAAFGLFVLSLMLSSQSVLVVAFGLLALSGVSFVIAPFLVMTKRRHRP